MAAKIKLISTGEEVKKARKELGVNQQTFWSRVGVTQSGGSRYESGRRIPKTVQALATLAFSTPSQAQTLLTKLRDGELL
jgi:predicted transcriptional regulator